MPDVSSKHKTPGCIYSLKSIRDAGERSSLTDPSSDPLEPRKLTAFPAVSIELAEDGSFIFNDWFGPVCKFWGIQAGADMFRLEATYHGIVRLYMTCADPDAEELIIKAREAWHQYYLSIEDYARYRSAKSERPSQTPKAKAAVAAAKKAYAKSLFDI